MYTCLCKGVSDRRIRELLAESCHTVRSLQKICQAGTDCGICLPEVISLVKEAKQNKD